MPPITQFLTDYLAAEADETTPERAAQIAQLALDIDTARAALAAAVAAWSAAVNDRAGVRRAGRLLRDLGYDVPNPPGPPSVPPGLEGNVNANVGRTA